MYDINASVVSVERKNANLNRCLNQCDISDSYWLYSILSPNFPIYLYQAYPRWNQHNLFSAFENIRKTPLWADNSKSQSIFWSFSSLLHTVFINSLVFLKYQLFWMPTDKTLLERILIFVKHKLYTFVLNEQNRHTISTSPKIV